MRFEDFKKMDRAEAVKTALFISDMEEVIAVAKKLESIQGVDGELVYYRDDGEELAALWWDGERDQWLVNMLRGSGA